MPATRLLPRRASLAQRSDAGAERGLTLTQGGTFCGELVPDDFASQKAEVCNPAWTSHMPSGVTQRIAASPAEDMHINTENPVKCFRIT